MYSTSSSGGITFNPRDSKYYVTFEGNTIETTVTDKAATATQWVREITGMYAGRPTAVGLDVEWLPHPIPHMSNKSATLQLCIDRRCLILQLFYMDEIPQSVKAFLLNPNFTFVGIEVGDDVSKLMNEYGLGCSSHMDVRDAAKHCWPGRFSRPGLKDLALEVCGLNMKKPIHVCKSNWQARVLTEAQIEYACIDAFASYKLGHKLAKKMYSTSSSGGITFNPRDSKYYVTFAGNTIETTVTDKAATATQWVREITDMYAGRPTAVGLDVEWLPHPVRYMSNKSATLQLCIDRKCLILQLFYMDEIPQSVKAFLLNPNFTFVGIEVGDDVSKLTNEYGLGCSSHMDVRDAAKRRWPGRFSRPGLKDLAFEVCGLNMKKPIHVCKSNWQARVPTEAQIEYACIDAFASYKLGHTLLDY